MRIVTLSQAQYTKFAYPAVAQSAAERLEDWEPALRLMRKLRDPALTQDAEVTVDEQKILEAGRVLAYAPRKLKEDQASFEVEEDEWKLWRARVEGYRLRVPLVAAEDLEATLDALRQAKSLTASAQKGDA